MTALVLGASGQDGTYLVRHLLAQGQTVVAAGRSIDSTPWRNWRIAGIGPSIERCALEYRDRDAVAALIKRVNPRAIYVLAGQSSVRRSYSEPADTIESHVLPILNVLQAVRLHGSGAHVVYASTTDCFGALDFRGDETMPFAANSPYAAGKIAGSAIARSFREDHGARCSIAFLSNHESILRSESFVFGKVLQGIAAIRRGEATNVTTGALSIERDWGYAPEFSVALARMAELPNGTDLIIATGQSVLLRDAVTALLEAFGVDPAVHLREEPSPADLLAIDRQSWNPARAAETIDWRAETRFPALAAQLRSDWYAAGLDASGAV